MKRSYKARESQRRHCERPSSRTYILQAPAYEELTASYILHVPTYFAINLKCVV